MSALIYAICSIGGVVVVVEHICDETNRAVWPPPMPFDDDKYVADVLVALDVVDGAVAVDELTEFTTRMFVRTILAFCCLLFTTIPLDKSSTIELPPISRVLFGTRP